MGVGEEEPSEGHADPILFPAALPRARRLCNALLGSIMLSCKRVTSLTLDAVKSLWGRLPRQAEARPGPAERSPRGLPSAHPGPAEPSPRACRALTPPFFHLYSPCAFLQDSTRGRLRPPPKAPQAQGGAPGAGPGTPGCPWRPGWWEVGAAAPERMQVLG